MNLRRETRSRAKVVEQRVLSVIFLFFGLRDQKMLNVLFRRFLDPSDVFSVRFIPLQSLRGATSSARNRYGHPRGAPTSTVPRFRLHAPRSFRSITLTSKSLSGSKKVFENEHFLISRPKKKKDSENAY